MMTIHQRKVPSLRSTDGTALVETGFLKEI